MDPDSERNIPLLPLQAKYVTFQPQESNANHSEAVDTDGSEDGYDHLESIFDQDVFDEYNMTSDRDERERYTLRRRTMRKEVAEFCRPRGSVTSNTPFMGALVDICLKKLKPEHHSVSEYMSKAGSPNNALLKVFKEKDNFRFTEGHITAYVVEILRCDTDVDVTDSDGNTALHLAAKKAFSNCAKELLKWGANPNKRNERDETALEVALHTGLNEDEDKAGKHSRFAAVVIEDMKPEIVRNIFVANGLRHCKISFHTLINNSSMQEAVQAILDTAVELIDSSKKVFRVHYSILESNSRGQTPDMVGRAQKKSAFDKIVGKEKKDIVTHSAVRFLIQSKWNRFARNVLISRAVLFVIIMTTMTAALLLGIDCANPSVYTTTLDIVRGVLEGLTLLSITAVLYTEVCQIAMWQLQYFTEYYFFYFSYLTIITAICLYIMVPLRIFDKRQQWVFGSIAYLCYGLKAFKFLMAIRSVGIYVHALALMFRKDVLLFIVVFAESLFAFSGAFFIALNSELVEANNKSQTVNCGSELETANQTILIPEAQLNKLETGSYFSVFFTGIRILIEGDSVIQNYAEHSGAGGLGIYGVIQYLFFLFFVVVVLLSLLIAQMSDTFANIQDDADRIALLIRARVVISTERTGILGVNFRKAFYVKQEIWKQPKKQLTDITVPKIDVVNAMVGRLEKLCVAHSDILEELRDSLADQRKKEEAKMDQLLEEIRRFNRQSHVP